MASMEIFRVFLLPEYAVKFASVLLFNLLTQPARWSIAPFMAAKLAWSLVPIPI